VIQDGDEYRLSLRFLHLGQGVRTSRTAYQLVKEKVEWLADETGERSQFIVEEQGCGVYMFCELGTDGVQTDSEIGKRIPLHATAAGKAILCTSGLPRRRDHRGSQTRAIHGPDPDRADGTPTGDRTDPRAGIRR